MGALIPSPLKNEQAFQPRQLGDIRRNIWRQVAAVILYPISHTLMIDLQHPADFAHGMTFQIELKRVETNFLIVSLILGERCIAAAARPATIALASCPSAAITCLPRTAVAPGASWTIEFRH